jgi:DNA-directed RNA polymerase specialized sigma24 family protein
MCETTVEEDKKQPKSVEEAIGFVGTSKSFMNKADKLVKDILKDHIDLGSSEYKPIREDAIGEVMEKMFEMIAKGQTDSEWYTTGLSKYGMPNCVLTPYMYKSVGNYARTRFDRWSDIKPGKTGGARARNVVPFDVDETDGSVEDWISTKVSELPNSDIEKAASQKKLSQILEATSLPNDIISIIMYKCDNFTFEEIGDKMGLSKDAIRMKLNRAKPILSSVLERDV